MQAHLEAKKEVVATPQADANTLLWLATAPEAGRSNAGYFHQRIPAECSAVAQDEAAAEKLWIESEALIARAGFKPPACAVQAETWARAAKPAHYAVGRACGGLRQVRSLPRREPIDVHITPDAPAAPGRRV